MQFSKAVGRAGWIAPTGSPVVAAVLSSLRGGQGDDGEDADGDSKAEDVGDGADGWVQVLGCHDVCWQWDRQALIL